jgi:hypothetical protein
MKTGPELQNAEKNEWVSENYKKEAWRKNAEK